MIRGQKSPAEPTRKITIPLEAKLHNRFDFEVVDSVTEEVKQRAYAENIILNTYWTRLFTPGIANNYIFVGTGTGTLAATRTALFTPLANKSSTAVTTVFNEAENWISHKRSAQWVETENQNTAWTEVGIGYSGGITTHALIKDLNGNPVTLNKGTTDIITVYATIYAYLPASTSDIRFNIPRNYGLASDSLIGWFLGLSGYLPCHRSFALKGNLFTTISGYSGSWSGALNAAYDPSGVQTTLTGSLANKKLKIAVNRLPAASYNSVSGVKSISFGVVSYPTPTSMELIMDLQLTTPGTWFPYSTIPAETVGTGDGSTLDFKTYFPFVKNDGSFILKKNGAVVDSADYTVDYGEPNGSDLIHHLKVLDYYGSGDALGCTMLYSTNEASRAARYLIFENPWYAKFGIANIGSSYAYIWASNTSPTGPWTSISPGAVAAQYQNWRYWKVQPSSANSGYSANISSVTSTALANAKNIHFASGKAPASGDVITADYRCEVIAKTANNVFDLSVEITLQEKVV